MRLILLPVCAALAAAITSANAGETDRYRLERTENGYVRMDTQSGEMSLCEERAGELVCRKAVNEAPSATPPLTAQAEIETLKARLKMLEDRVVALEGSLSAKIEKSLPSEEDFNQTLGYMERFFRSFMGIVRDFENETGKPGDPVPDRT